MTLRAGSTSCFGSEDGAGLAIAQLPARSSRGWRHIRFKEQVSAASLRFTADAVLEVLAGLVRASDRLNGTLAMLNSTLFQSDPGPSQSFRMLCSFVEALTSPDLMTRAMR